ncbi:MAG: phosphoglycerate mutase family protein [Actinomycetia bacterium]|nr:phosphoglycerate mutase family protein [Actinomycetes bacterium]
MTLYVIRHAKAGQAPDEERPLNDAGQRQAERIAELLADAGVERVLTSRYTRCVQTVTPLAAQLGLDLEHHDALAEESDTERAWALLESLAGTETVLCSHGNLIHPLLDRVLRRGAEIEGEWVCRKGSIWCLHPDGDRPFGRAVLLQA